MLGVTVIQGFGDVSTDRFDSGCTSSASYDARMWGAMAELSHYVALPNNWRFVPRLTFDWLRSRTDAFVETGGTNPISGSSVTANRIRMLAGGEIGRSWLAGRQIFDFSVYARPVDNMAQNIDDLVINDTIVVTAPQLVSGIRENTRSLSTRGATFSVKVSQVVRLHAVCDGRLCSNLTSTAVPSARNSACSGSSRPSRGANNGREHARKWGGSNDDIHHRAKTDHSGAGAALRQRA